MQFPAAIPSLGESIGLGYVIVSCDSFYWTDNKPWQMCRRCLGCLGYRFLSSQEVQVGTLFVLAITVGEVFIGRQIAAGIGYR